MSESKMTTDELRAMKARGEKIASLTAYDFPMAKLLDQAGIPLILVVEERFQLYRQVWMASQQLLPIDGPTRLDLTQVGRDDGVEAFL